jgi:hypothetical protein
LALSPGCGNGHDDRATDQLGERREHGIGDGSTPILADEIHRPTGAELPNQLGDVGRERASVEEAIVGNLGRWKAPQIRRHGAVASGGERRHLMAPGVGGVRKAVQKEDEWTVAPLEIGELEAVDADALHEVPLPDEGKYCPSYAAQRATLTGRGERMRASGPVERDARRPIVATETTT